MKLSHTPDVHLTYGLNIHPGESWAENLESIRVYALSVKNIVAPSRPFGLGLRLSRRAADELSDAARRRAFKEFLGRNDVYVFTVNAFPYGVFHGKPVKEKVYRPDWSRVERLRYTERVAHILADLLPDGVGGSISTVPLGYEAETRSPNKQKAMVRNLAEMAVTCARIRDRCGHDVHVGLEPEPDCLLETTDQTCAFFTDTLYPQGALVAAKLAGCSVGKAETMLRRHIGVCVDTCHLALQFEDVPLSLERLADAGVRLSKIQLSAALKTRSISESLAGLEHFLDPVYLHQVTHRGPDGTIHSLGDLEKALAEGAGRESAGEWRVHVHVPLVARLRNGLASTAASLDRRFFEAVRRHRVEHLEIETYTFDVLPASLRRETVVQSVARDWAWVCRRWRASAC